MREKALAVVCLLALCLPATAQIEGPTKVTFAPGERNCIITFTANTDRVKKALHNVNGSLEADRIFDPSPLRLVIKVIPRVAGEKCWINIAYLMDGEIFFHKCLVEVVGDGPPPIPVPPDPRPPEPKPPEPRPPEPKPPEPVPVDPLVKSLQDAAAADGMPKSELAKMSKAVEEVSRLETKGLTHQRAYDNIKNMLANKDKFPPLDQAMFKLLYGLTAEPLNGLLKDPTQTIDQSKADTLRNLFVKIAKALEEASR